MQQLWACNKKKSSVCSYLYLASYLCIHSYSTKELAADILKFARPIVPTHFRDEYLILADSNSAFPIA